MTDLSPVYTKCRTPSGKLNFLNIVALVLLVLAIVNLITRD
jgi:hypothetical protein